MNYKWNYEPPTQERREAAEALAHEVNIHPALGKLLLDRGITTAFEARRFFRPQLTGLLDPFLFRDMPVAVERLNKALGRKERILVYGDYDVDGCTAVALVYRFLQQFTTNIDFYIHFGLNGYASLFFDRKTPWGKWEQSYQNCYFDKQGKGSLKEFSENYTKAFNATKNLGYIAVPSANHDYQRPNIGTRNTPDQLKVAMTFFLTMPGIPFIYYGDEIGMKYQMNLPNKEGSNERSGTRTPMQWTKGKNAGFSTSAPDKLYFPVDTENGKLTVEAQQGDPKSLLSYTCNLTALRHSAKALDNEGDWKLLNQKGQEYPMVYERTLGEERYVVVVNPGAKAASLNISSVGGKAVSVLSTGKVVYKSGKKTDVIKASGISAAIFKVER